MKFSNLVWAFLVSVSASAVETGPVEVLSVTSGLEIVVKTDLGGQPCPITVRLSHIVLADPVAAEAGDQSADNLPSTRKLVELLPSGSFVTMQTGKPQFEVDQLGRVLAIVCQDTTSPADGSKSRRCLQVELLGAGLAKFQPEGETDFYSLFQVLQAAEQKAKVGKLGIWADQPEDASHKQP